MSNLTLKTELHATYYNNGSKCQACHALDHTFVSEITNHYCKYYQKQFFEKNIIKLCLFATFRGGISIPNFNGTNDEFVHFQQKKNYQNL